MRRRQKYALANQAAREAALSSVTLIKANVPGATFVVKPSPVEWTAIAPPTIWPTDPHACTKCGRTVGRGRAMHEKHCKGA